MEEDEQVSFLSSFTCGTMLLSAWGLEGMVIENRTLIYESLGIGVAQIIFT